MPKPKSPKPPEHPEILLDVDGTCLDSAGKFNTNLFKALKAMGIKQANILSSFEMKKLDAYLEDKSFRCLVIDELKKTGINTGYVIVNASPYLDVDDKDQGKLGSYYRNTIEKFERRILKIRKKNPDVLDLDVTEQRKLEPPKMREQEILGIESKQREQAVLARESSGIAAPMESVAELTETQKRDNEKVERIRKKLQPKTESFVDWHKFKGGKERMILHVLQHKPSSNFIVFDDKEEVNNTVERMDVDSENFPAANGRMHAVKVDMKNRKQTEDYYIRKLIQGYSISQLKQFIETHAKELADGKELLRYLLNAIPQEEEIKEKQKGIYAQLVLAYWHPHDIENIVELYQKLSQEETISADLEGAFANVMLASLENPAFRIKILDAAIANIDENKKTPFKDYLVSDIKKTSLEHYTMLAEKDSEKWTPLVQQISENKCETTNDLLLLRSSIQLGLAMKDKQDIEELTKLMIRAKKARKEIEEGLVPDLAEQEKVKIIEENISKAIAHTAYNPRNYLELLRYYRDFKSEFGNTPEKEAFAAYLTPELMQKTAEILISLNPPQPQPWKFIGYPVLKEMFFKTGKELELTQYVKNLERNYPDGNHEIASLMISLITGYTDIRFYPAQELPQIANIDTKNHQLALLLALAAKDKDAIDKIKDQFINNKDLESCLFLIEGIKQFRGSLSPEIKRNLGASLIDRIDALLASKQLPTDFDNYLIDPKAKNILEKLNQDDKKGAILKHAALCALAGVAEKLTQEETKDFLLRLNNSMQTICAFDDGELSQFAKESTMEATKEILNKLDGTIAYVIKIGDFKLDLSSEEKELKIRDALKNRTGNAPYLFIQNEAGDFFYHTANQTRLLDEQQKQLLNLTATQIAVSLEPFQRLQGTFPAQERDHIFEPALESEIGKIFDNCLSSSLDCYNYLKKDISPSNFQKELAAQMAVGKVLETLRKTVTNEGLAQYLKEENILAKSEIEKNLQLIAYADYLSNTVKPSLNEIMVLANELNNLKGRQDSLVKKGKLDEAKQLEGLISTITKIQHGMFNHYVTYLEYNEETENEINNLQYFKDKQHQNDNLKEILDASRAVLTDVARLPETKTDVLKAMARTAQALLEPSDNENKKELQAIGQKFKFTPSLNLLGKAILVLLSTLAAGVGLFVTGGIVANQTYKDSRLFKALYKDTFKPESESEEDKRQEGFSNQ